MEYVLDLVKTEELGVCRKSIYDVSHGMLAGFCPLLGQRLSLVLVKL